MSEFKCLTSFKVPFTITRANMEPDSKPKYNSGAVPVQRILDLIECFRAHERDLELSEIAQRTNLAKSTAYRLLASLAERGYVIKGERGTYSLGPKSWEIACRWISGMDFIEQSRPHMERLSEEFGQSVYIALLSGKEVVYVAKQVAVASVIMHVELGSRAPAHATASGKAILAFSPGATLERFLARGLPAFTPRTVTDVKAFRDLLDTVRAQGYALNYGERDPDLMGVGAALRDHTGWACAAITMGGSASRLTKRILEQKAAPAVCQAANEISTSLGFIKFAEDAHPGGREAI